MFHLTARQQEVLAFMTSHHSAYGRFPMLTEIAAHFKFGSTTAARHHMLNMSKKGAVTNQNRKWICSKPSASSPAA